MRYTLPIELSFLNSSMILPEVYESNEPTGSSARIMFGLFIIALALPQVAFVLQITYLLPFLQGSRYRHL